MTGLLRAAHPGPALAVTGLVALLALSVDLGPGRFVLLVAAVLTGQLSIGWSNDLIDAARDRRVGRSDKPLATGSVDTRTVTLACGTALAATVPLSLALGPAAGAVNLLLHVGGGWAYNLGLKATAWSWAPYAVAFGSLPAVVALAAGAPVSWSSCAAGALLGVGAHLLNALPDLADDAATGVRGLPHRLGARWAAPVAVLVLAVATLVVVGAAPASGTRRPGRPRGCRSRRSRCSRPSPSGRRGARRSAPPSGSRWSTCSSSWRRRDTTLPPPPHPRLPPPPHPRLPPPPHPRLPPPPHPRLPPPPHPRLPPPPHPRFPHPRTHEEPPWRS